MPRTQNPKPRIDCAVTGKIITAIEEACRNPCLFLPQDKPIANTSLLQAAVQAFLDNIENIEQHYKHRIFEQHYLLGKRLHEEKHLHKLSTHKASISAHHRRTATTIYTIFEGYQQIIWDLQGVDIRHFRNATQHTITQARQTLIDELGHPNDWIPEDNNELSTLTNITNDEQTSTQPLVTNQETNQLTLNEPQDTTILGHELSHNLIMQHDQSHNAQRDEADNDNAHTH